MALIRFSNLVNDIRGSSGGNTFSRGLAGATVSMKRTVSVPEGTAFRSKGFGISEFTKVWRTLSEADRQHWSSAAKSMSAKNRLGLSRILSGIELFTKVNHYRKLAGYSLALDLSLQVSAQVTFYSSFVRSSGTNQWLYLLRFATQNAGTYLVYMSKPVPPGQSKPSLSKFKFIKSQVYLAESNRNVTAAEYQASFGQGWAVSGATYFVELFFVPAVANIPIYLGGLQNTAP